MIVCLHHLRPASCRGGRAFSYLGSINNPTPMCNATAYKPLH
jgi:hypothetical protein